MAVLFTDVVALTQVPGFQAKVKVATLKAAGFVLADPTKEDEFKYAGRVVLEPDNEYLQAGMRYQVALNAVITEQSSDSDIEFTVNSNFRKIALQFAAG